MRRRVTLAVVGVCEIRVYFAELGQQPRIFRTAACRNGERVKLEINEGGVHGRGITCVLTRIQVWPLSATTSTLTPVLVVLPEFCARASFFPLRSTTVATCDRASLNVLPIAIMGGGDDRTSFHTAMR